MKSRALPKYSGASSMSLGALVGRGFSLESYLANLQGKN
ncbi:hypothetical protein TCARB_1565 [Thermofilum adornatum 1505]|uniref:Uncharacterized protein n=1 Tax=Thermofilum adornatum 1505 TaxID=697581 RepID=A0A3G1A9T5_9CREN|nr:hypothetical protein TCARB_1565 [Thermofilum adornatum 1505]